MGISAKVIILGNNLEHRKIGNAVKSALDAATRDFHCDVIQNADCFSVIQYNNQNPDKKIKVFSTISGHDFINLYIDMTYKLVDRHIQIFAPVEYNDYRELDNTLSTSLSVSMGAGVEHTEEIINVIRKAIRQLKIEGARVFYTYNDCSDEPVEDKENA